VSGDDTKEATVRGYVLKDKGNAVTSSPATVV
jgi:hypothetical protein